MDVNVNFTTQDNWKPISSTDTGHVSKLLNYAPGLRRTPSEFVIINPDKDDLGKRIESDESSICSRNKLEALYGQRDYVFRASTIPFNWYISTTIEKLLRRLKKT